MPAGSARAALLAVYDDSPAVPGLTMDTLDIQPKVAVQVAGPIPLARPGAMVTPATLTAPGQLANPATAVGTHDAPAVPPAPAVYAVTPRVSLWSATHP